GKKPVMRNNQFVFPAPAGINGYLSSCEAETYRVPRASGDKPRVNMCVPAWVRCSPRQRG
ncbi:hypothetical protein KXT50_24455, partial [Salmonella enterica subsp. enterica serovar Weltevreden]|nr:hypothetical protein [Salmonella enterica subsp. enterica serovar Weltevreden]